MNEIILEFAALLLTTFCLIYSETARRRLYFPLPKGVLAALKSQHFCFLLMLFTLGASAAFSVAGILAQRNHAGPILIETLNTLYYAFHNMLSVFFALYILNMTGPVKDQGRKFFLIFCLPLAVAELLILSNPFTHLCFSINADLVYQRGPGLWSLYLIAAVYTVVGYLYFFKFTGSQSKSDRASMLILVSIAIVGVLIQGIWGVLVELFFESIAFLGFMVLLEREEKFDGGFDKQFSGGVIVAIALTFFAVILMNVTQTINLNAAQADEIGNVQLDVIRGDLQSTISRAETSVLRVAMGAEQLVGSEDSREELEQYLSEQRENLADDESFLNVYLLGEQGYVIPGYETLPNDRASDPDWYRRAKSRPGECVVSEPYRDEKTGQMCFTVATVLSDATTVAAMDLDFSAAQKAISQMMEGPERTAMIVSPGGLIVGHADPSLIGTSAEERLPEYEGVLRRVAASRDHAAFRTRIDGKPCKVFSSETSNGWDLILCVSTRSLYANSYRQTLLICTVNLLMLVVVVVFYMINTRNRLRMASMLEERERFLAGLAGKLRKPVTQILRLSDRRLIEESENPGELIGQIKESGIRLSEAVNDIQSYSGILREHTEQARSAKKRVNAAGAPNRKVRSAVVLTLLFAMLIALYFSARSTVSLGSSRLNRAADSCEGQMNAWFGEREGVVKMLTGLFSSRPELLEDYDGTVRVLDGISEKYPEIMACYIVNPGGQHPMIVSSSRRTDESVRARMHSAAGMAEHAAQMIHISAPFVDEKTGETCVSFFRPVNDEAGNYLGVFGIDCSIEKPIRALREKNVGTGYAFLVDSDGMIVNHPNPAYQFAEDRRVSVELTEYAKAYHSENVTILRDYSGRLVSCLSRVTPFGVAVVTAERCQNVYGRTVLLSLASLGLFAICIVFIVMLINRLIRWQEEVNHQLRDAADAAVSAGKAKSQFLAQMSHEIRTPINAVLGMNDMILGESSDPDILEYAENIRSAGRTLLSLINSILDFSKIEDGKMELMNVRYDTARLVDDLVNMVSERVVKKGLELETDIDPDLPRTLYGDDMRLRQIITNILTNAIKYTPSGSITLQMRLLERAEEHCVISVSVTDTGIGIREEDIRKLFDSFLRLEQERNRGIEGTGLGIVIVQRLLEMMGSTLEVQSVYGQGSVFSFRLEQQIIDPTPIGQYREHRSAATRLSERRTVWAPEADVLVVDDNEMNLKVAKGLLKRAGIVPDLTDSGQSCLEMSAKKHYDLIFLDHMMPEMDGIETLRALRARGDLPADTVIIVLTANAVAGAREEYLKAGFRDYLPKPIDVQELNQMLARYLPDEKLTWRNAAPAAKAAPGTDDPLKTLAAAGLRTDAGLRYAAGDRDFYLELLRSFAAQQEENARALRSDWEREDYRDYRILVHALKSSARTVGADELADLALTQENAAKNADATALAAGIEPLLLQYRETAEAIRTALSAQENPGTAAGEEIDTETLRGVLTEAMDCVGRFEAERAAALLKTCKDDSFRGSSLRDALEEVIGELENFETDAAEAHLKALLAACGNGGADNE